MNVSENVWEYKKVKLSDDLTINVVDFGITGQETVVFLHGYADSWRSFERVIQAFPPNYRCLAVDLRGHGDSSKPERHYALKDFVEDMRLVLESLGIGSFTLVGHSMGSFIAQLFAATYPEKIENLVLVSSACKAVGNQILAEIHDDIMKLQDPVDESFISEFQAPSLPVPQEFMQTIIAESKKIPARIWKMVFKELQAMDNSDLLCRIQAKTLVLWGEKDAIFTRDDQELLTSKIATSRFIAYDAGHALHWEIPELAAKDMSRFLKHQQ